jgi:hypothetical protein
MNPTRKILVFLLLIIFLAGCQSGSPSESTNLPVLPSATQTPEATLQITETQGPTPTPSITATPDARLPPERWQEWPIVPAVTGRAIEIYRQGLALGNNPHAFSKVGDCQSVKAAMMGYLDIPDRIPKTADYLALQETIDNFSGYFNTDGQAVKGGFNAAAALSPLWANPEVCLAGENPLECELRVTKPIIVFISFEVWWPGRTAEQYENYMRQIIETVIAHGAVPILGTKADNVEGDHSINLTTARLAHEYDLPLWNFWLAVQPLPNHGMDLERGDGFHITETDGWSVRSFTALQTLDSIWRGVRDATAADSAIPTATPIPVETSGLLPTPVSGPSLSNGDDLVVFGVAARDGNAYQPQGVYLFDLNMQTRAQLLGTGWDFQAAYPDGSSLLVNMGSSLYHTDGISLALISSDFYAFGNTGATYLDDGSIVFIVTQGTGTALAHAQNDGSGMTILTKPGETPIELYSSSDGISISWESGSCRAYRECDRQGAWLTDLQTGESRSLVGISHPLISPDGEVMAYVYDSGENKTNLALATADGIPTRTFPLYGDILVDYAWEPGGGWLAVHLAVWSDYYGKVTDGMNYLFDPQTFDTRRLPSVLLLNPRILWSTDGESLAWLGTDLLGDEYSIRLFRVDVQSGQTINLTDSLALGDMRYLFVTNGTFFVTP